MWSGAAAGASPEVAIALTARPDTVTSAISAAEIRKEAASSSATPVSPSSPTTAPPSGGPARREIFWFIELSAFAAVRCSSPTRRGSSAASAGAKNCASDDSTNETA